MKTIAKNLNNFRFLAVISTLVLACGEGTAAAEELELELEESESALSSGNRVSEWFPQETGNTWALESSAGTQISVESTLQGRAGTLSGLFETELSTRVAGTTGTILYAVNPQTTKAEPFLKFGSSSSWRFSPNAQPGPCATLVVTRSSTGDRVKTPAGTFTDTRTFSLGALGAPNVRCAAPPWTRLIFARGVGLIQATTGGGEVLSLQSAVVAGVRYPKSYVTGSVATDATLYKNQPNTIRCITFPCPGNEQTATATVTYTLRNAASSAYTYHFSSSCQWNVELRNASGALVRNLSMERACMEVLTQFSIPGKGKKTLSQTLELRDATGAQLPPGAYTLKAYLLPRLHADPAPATTTFTIVN